MKPIFIALLALLLLATAAVAEENLTRNNLEARYQHMACRAELVKAQAEIMSGMVNSTPDADTITANIQKLKEYSDAGDVKGFNTYAKTTLTTSFKAFSGKMLASRNEWVTMNKSRRERREALTEAITDWKAAIAAFSDCNNNARRNLATVREQQVTAAIEKWNQIISDMKAKNLNTTVMEEVVADAEELNAMLQEANGISDDTAFNAKIEEARQLQLHLWARFNIARIESYMQALEPNVTSDKDKETVSQIRAMLSSSKAIAAKGDKYPEGAFEQVWQNISQAGEKLKQLAKGIKGDAQ
jgi:hypothetical protein